MKRNTHVCNSLLLLVAFVAAFFLATPSRAAAQTAQNAPAGNAQKGKDAFTKTCVMCHGAAGQGAIGPTLAPPPRAFADFTRYVRQPGGAMPAFAPQAVSDADLADIFAFLQSANPSPSSNFSALNGNAQTGARIYVSYGCYECHGRVGQGAQQTGAPRIGPPALTIDAFARYIHQPSGNMPPYTSKVVSDQAIADIFAFLKSVPPAPPAKSIPLLNQ
jgi:mono/diheme cytochrome c family protein